MLCCPVNTNTCLYITNRVFKFAVNSFTGKTNIILLCLTTYVKDKRNVLVKMLVMLFVRTGVW